MPYLFTMGNVATLLGLLGTVIGLVRTFSGGGCLGSFAYSKPCLSSGISTALNATAFGLMVAVPCMLSYGFLFNRINGIVDEIEHYSARLLDVAQNRKQSTSRISQRLLGLRRLNKPQLKTLTKAAKRDVA